MVIDGGPGSESYMISMIVHRKLSQIKYLVATHPHEDHVGGLASVLTAAPVDLILSPVLDWDTLVFKNMLKYAEAQGTPIVVPYEGDEYSLGGATITILHCWPEAWTVNDMSIVLRIDYGNTSVLFTGDAETMSEYMMVDSDLPLKADVLKVGHHGSNSSSSFEFLDAVSPQYAVISCGYGNIYGHPNRETLYSLKRLGVTLFRTDMQGMITMHSDGENITFETERTTKRDVFAAPGTETEEPEATIPPGAEITYVLNIKSHRFHLPTCGSVNDMKPENRQDFYGTREDAINMGYTPCGSCNP